ncbi:MAG: peptidylprolyl isomerase [Nitrospira sp.]|nr:peptidylprolyl isomerase [Nitrospira sp.]MCA9464379.1 peptidylprolyl isomerase [Nitrospira sp.]MCA9475161.1 peptidylprolyl isomerase [Nitrospira sp.]MCA9479488.1 peptidylprolyl isomerase [Nitrospira sp.]
MPFLRVVVVMAGIITLLAGTWGISPAWAEADKDAESKAPRAILKTKFGEMEIVLFPDLAPKHVESFVKLAKSGFFNGTIFHRVIPGFMIQGGDPLTKDPSNRSRYGTGGPGYTLPAEFSRVPHEKGILSAARTADPNSAGSQFFIMVDKAPHLDGQYTIFGEVVKGVEIADTIVNQPRDLRDNPLERIEMTIEIIE